MPISSLAKNPTRNLSDVHGLLVGLAFRGTAYLRTMSTRWLIHFDRILCMKTLSSVALFVTAGPRVEIYTELVCKEYYPDLIEIPIPGVLTQLSGATTAANTVLTSGGQESPIEVYLPADDPGIHSSHNLRASMHSSRHSEICKSDPRIQAEVARLAASMYPGLTLLASLTTVPSVAIAFIGGVLSCMTTGWWGGVCAHPHLIITYTGH